MDRWNGDVRRPIVSELDDQLGEIGFLRVDPARGVGRKRLHLDHLESAGRFDHDPICLRTVGRPVHDAAGGADRALELFEVDVEVSYRPLLDPLSRLAQLLPVAELCGCKRALLADRVRGMVSIAAEISEFFTAKVPPKPSTIPRRGAGSASSRELHAAAQAARRLGAASAANGRSGGN